jgi:hypothetical protein
MVVDVTVNDYCQGEVAPASVSHGTAVLSILASPDYGWAPKAKYLFYATPSSTDQLAGFRCTTKNVDPGPEAMINQAITDGADIISVSKDLSPAVKRAMARAEARGVIVVVASGNDGELGPGISSGASSNAIVAVGADDKTGKRASFSSYGTGLTIMAPGAAISLRDPDASGKLTVIKSNVHGTSFATPMVAGALALAKQAYPHATANQLLRSMIATAVRSGSGWDPGWGWGNLNVNGLTSRDPSGEPDTNPLMDKAPDSEPTMQQVADYLDGLAEPMSHDPDYVYRGVDPDIIKTYPKRSQPGTSPRYKTAPPIVTASPSGAPIASVSASPSASVPGGGPADVPWLLVGGVAGVGVAAAVLLVVRSRRRPSRADRQPPSTPEPD